MNNKKKFTRYTALSIIVVSILVAIFARLIYLQVFKADYYRAEANTNNIKEINEPAPRGNILDRNNVVLAATQQSYELTFTETDESKAKFFDTMEMVFKMLDENGEKQQDDFELKINPFKFEFNTSDPKQIRTLELRFKKDRGLDDSVIANRYGKDKKKSELTDDEKKVVDEDLLKITPEQTFQILWKQYTDNYLNSKKVDSKLKEKIKGYNVEQQRRFMIVKDAMYMQSFSGYKPVVIASNIKRDTAFIFSQKLSELSGVDVSLQPIRYYPFNDLGSAFLGYISKINPDQKEKYEEKGYDVNTDYIGTAGIESAFEDRLKGTKGMKIVEVNTQGRMVREKAAMDPYPGQNIKLNIDKNVQYAGEKSLDIAMQNLQKTGVQADGVNTSNATRGAAVAIDCNTGGVLALVSRPGFDPNDFAIPGRLTTELSNKYFHPDLEQFGKQFIQDKGLQQQNSDKTPDQILNMLFPVDTTIKSDKPIRKDMYDLYPKPLYNYATGSLLPPGSTFKALTAVAGLQEGVITPDTTILDDGIFNKHLKNYQGSCWIYNEYHGSHGWLNVVGALEKSCNYFFFEVGDRLYEKGGYDLLAKYAWKFGLGIDPKGNQKPSTGIEIYEKFGQVYNMEYSKKNKIAIFVQGLVSDLKSGTDRQGNHYKDGIDLLVNKDSDSTDLVKMKTQVLDLIKEQMSASKVNDNQVYKQIQAMLKAVVSNSPNLKDKSFSDKDIANAANAVMFAIYDCRGEINTPGNVYDASIGQGISVFTPVQLANYIATLANGGTRYEVHLVDKCLDQNGNVLLDKKPKVMDKVTINPETLQAIKDGMVKVNSGEDGTAGGVFDNFPMQTAGKTGSASVASEDQQKKEGRTSCAVYVGFAPVDKPRIAVCAVILDGGHGGFAAPVARAMYEAYFKDELKKQYNYVPPSEETYMQDMYKN